MADGEPHDRDPSPHAAFIAGLPKAELHVHHVGSASPTIVAGLAARHPGTLPEDPEALAELFAFRDFDHFIEVYQAVASLVVTPEDVRLLTYGVAAEMAEQGIRYAELTATPVTSVQAGIPIEAFVEAIEDGRTAAQRDLGIRLAWIFDIPGELVPNGAEDTAGSRLSTGRPAWSASDSAGPRSAPRGRGSSRPSTGPGPRDCTASPTRGRRPDRSPSGMRSTRSAPSASGTPPARRRIRR